MKNSAAALGSQPDPDVSWEQLEQLSRWVASAKATKAPITRNGYEARVNDPSHWGTRDVAVQWCEAIEGGGVGFVLGPDPHSGLAFFGVDFDSCRDPLEGFPERSAVDAHILEIVQELGTYCEISPSGTGLHVFGLYHAADIEILRKLMNGAQWGRTFTRGGGDHPPSIEPFFGHKYFTVTRDHLVGTPSELQLVPLAVLERLLTDWGPNFARTGRGRAKAKRSRDDSNSGHGFRLAKQMRMSGHTYEQYLEMLPNHADPEIRAWYDKHQDERDQREFRRAWENARVEDLPHVEITKGKFPQVAAEIEKVAREAGLLIYSRDGKLCYPRLERRSNLRPDGSTANTMVAALRDYSRYSLRRALDQAMKFAVRGRTDELQLIEPPPDLINMVLAGGAEQAFPTIRGIVGTPTFRSDLSLLVEPGFDERTGLYLLDPPDMPPIPDNPTKEDARNALDLLLDLDSEFCYANDVSLSVGISAKLTPSVRAACPVVPGHLFNAPIIGSGKSLLAHSCVMLHTGYPAHVLPAGHSDPKELDKLIASAMLSGQQFIVLDNLKEDPDSAVLAQLLDQPHISVRIMTTTNLVRVDNNYCTYLTGNNVNPAEDNKRRMLVCRLDPRMENPLEREFKSNPLERIKEDRGKYVAACLTIVRAYVAAGYPNPLPPLAGYGEWSRLVREPLVWLGLADPVVSIRNTLISDQSVASLDDLLEAWEAEAFDASGVKAADVIKRAYDKPTGNLIKALNAIEAVKNRRGDLDVMRLGIYLASKVDNIVNGRSIRKAGSDRTKISRWVLATEEAPPKTKDSPPAEDPTLEEPHY